MSSSAADLSTGDVSEEERPQDEGDYALILPPNDLREVTTLADKKDYEMVERLRKPPYAYPHALEKFQDTGEFDEGSTDEAIIKLGTMEELYVRSAGAYAARVLNVVGQEIAKNNTITTEEIDDVVTAQALHHAVYPSPLHYKGFPRTCCTSVNNIIAHGIPDNRHLQNGDIVNVDITMYSDGFHGDTSRMFLIGNVDNIGRDLVKITEEALEAGIAACGPGRPFRDIAKAIHRVIECKDYVVCPAFTGHGIGKGFHLKPWILHDLNEEPEIMKPGHCFTIEPCIIKGSDPDIYIWPDGWTASTATLARSAQAEHMLLITETGVDVLTRDDKWLAVPLEKKYRLIGIKTTIV